MNDEDIHSGPHAEPRSVRDRNIERLLQRAYDPEQPRADFAARVDAAMLAAAQEAAAGRRAGPRKRKRALGWAWMGVAAAAAVAIGIGIGIALAPGPVSGPPAGPRRADRPAAGIDRAPARPAPRERSPLAAGALRPRPLPPAPPAEAVAVGQTVRTGVRQRRRVAMPDGSILFVNADTSVEVTGPRRVHLRRGELYARVAQVASAGRAEPFLVQTPDRLVRAVGTRLGVRVAGQRSGVLVTQGKVGVSDVGGLLHAGQRLAPGGARRAAMPRASYLLNWTRDLMAAGTAPVVPESPHAGGALVAVDPHGQQVKLSLRRLRVDVHVEDGFARTTIDQTYFNHATSRMEGTFYFPLPADASLSRLAMYVNGKLNEGGMVERSRARYIYEDIVSTMRDPALLEWVDGTTFKMRVFPLEARQEKRIILSYTQKLPVLYDRTTYRFPAGHSMEKVGRWSFHARVRHAAGAPWECASHELTAARDGADLLLDAEARSARPDRDVVLHLRDARAAGADEADVARLSSAVHEGSRYLMLRLRPRLAARPRRQRRHWVFLFESSADRNPVLARTQVEIVRGILDGAEHDDTFALLTANTRPRLLTDRPLPATPENVAAAIDFLDETHLVGSLDLEQALDAACELCAAAPNAHLVHLGSGIPVLGSRKREALLGRLPAGVTYVGIGVGKRWSRPFLRGAAARTGGYFTQINPDENIPWRAFDLVATLNTPRLLNVRVTGDRDGQRLLCTSDSLAAGEQLCAILRLDKADRLPGVVNVRGILDGKDWSTLVPVADVAGGADYLPRIWTRLEIDRLLAESSAKNRSRIVALSKAMYVMSPFTSLLVLENEKMYKDYGVDRGRKDHWALYPAPEKIPVVHEPLPAKTAPAPRRAKREPQPGKPAKPAVEPWQRKTLRTLLVRVRAPFFQAEGQRQSTAGESRHVSCGLTAWQLHTGAEAVPLYVIDRSGATGRFGTVRGLGLRDLLHTRFDGDRTVDELLLPWDPITFSTSSYGLTAPRIAFFNGDMAYFPTDFDERQSASYLPYYVHTVSGNGAFLYTTVTVPDGGTILLGGRRFTGRVKAGEQGVPVLGTIPSLGRLFRQSSHLFVDDTYSRRPWGRALNGWDVDRDLDGMIVWPLRGNVDVREARIPWHEYLGFPIDWQEVAAERRARRLSPIARADADARVRDRLDREIERLRFDDIDLSDVVQFLREYSETSLHVNWRALHLAGIDRHTKVSVDLRNVTVRRALELILRDVSTVGGGGDAGLGYAVDRGVLTISTRGDFARELIRRVYDIRDLLVPVPGFRPRIRDRGGVFGDATAGSIFDDGRGEGSGLFDAGRGSVFPEPGGWPVLEAPRRELRDEMAEDGVDRHEADQGGGFDSIEEGPRRRPSSEAEMLAEDFSDVVRASIEPDSWSDPETGGGGIGHLGFYNGLLVVTHTADKHRKLAKLITDLRGAHGRGPVAKRPRLRAESSAPQPAAERLGPDVAYYVQAAARQLADPKAEPSLLLTVPYRRPVFAGSGEYFDNLLLYAPGLATTRADVLAALAAAAPPEARPKPGRIDPAARKLVERARAAGWQAATFAPARGSPDAEPLTVTFDGAGRCAFRHRVGGTLEEHVVCDGKTLLHLYPEIGLGARRTVSRFHRAEMLDVIPWLLPPVTDLAVGADVRSVDGRTVVVAPHPRRNAKPQGKRRVVHLLFAEDGRLAERRLVNADDGQVTLRETYAPDGTLRVLDGKGKLLARAKYALEPADPPDLKPDTRDLLILPMPVRTPEHVVKARGLDLANRGSWSMEDTLAHAAAGIIHGREMHRWRSRLTLGSRASGGDRRLGLYVLLAATGARTAPPAELAHLPAARYLAARSKGGAARESARAKEGGEGFLARLAGFQHLWRELHRARGLDDDVAKQRWRDAALEYVRKAPPSVFTWSLLAELARLPGRALTREARVAMAEAFERHAVLRGLHYAARHEAARALHEAGRPAEAAQRFKKLADDCAARHVPLAVDTAFYGAMRGRGWRELIRGVARRMLEARAYAPAVNLAWQCYEVGDAELGAELLGKATAAAPAEQRGPLKLAAVKYHCRARQWARADERLAEALADERLAKMPLLWRAAARIAANGGRTARAVQCLQRAVELELDELPEKVDVRLVRSRYAELMNGYAQLAQAVGSPDAAAPRGLLAGVVRAADRWRTLDPDPAGACRAAARALRRAGADELAWAYLTTPLAERPDEPQRWLALAGELKSLGDGELADRAYAAAAETAPANPQILWDRAELLQQRGMSDRAEAIYRRITDGSWQPNYKSLQDRAKDMLKR